MTTTTTITLWSSSPLAGGKEPTKGERGGKEDGDDNDGDNDDGDDKTTTMVTKTTTMNDKDNDGNKNRNDDGDNNGKDGDNDDGGDNDNKHDGDNNKTTMRQQQEDKWQPAGKDERQLQWNGNDWPAAGC